MTESMTDDQVFLKPVTERAAPATTWGSTSQSQFVPN